MQATVKGKITKITGFGAFVSTDDGKTGMIHFRDIVGLCQGHKGLFVRGTGSGGSRYFD